MSNVQLFRTITMDWYNPSQCVCVAIEEWNKANRTQPPAHIWHQITDITEAAAAKKKQRILFFVVVHSSSVKNGHWRCRVSYTHIRSVVPSICCCSVFTFPIRMVFQPTASWREKEKESERWKNIAILNTECRTVAPPRGFYWRWVVHYSINCLWYEGTEQARDIAQIYTRHKPPPICG